MGKNTAHLICTFALESSTLSLFVMDSMMFLSEIRSLIKGITNLNEMVDVICARYHFTEDAAREYILACAFADSLNL